MNLGAGGDYGYDEAHDLAPPEQPKPDIAYMSEFRRTSRFSSDTSGQLRGRRMGPSWGKRLPTCARIEPAALRSLALRVDVPGSAA